MKHTELNGKAVLLTGRKEDLEYLSSKFCFDDFGIYHYCAKFPRINPETNEEEQRCSVCKREEYYLKSSSFDSKTNDRNCKRSY